MAMFDECDTDQLREAVRACINYVPGWADNAAAAIVRYMEGLDARLANAANDMEAQDIVADAFLDEAEIRKLLASGLPGSVGVVGVGRRDILKEIR